MVQGGEMISSKKKKKKKREASRGDLSRKKNRLVLYAIKKRHLTITTDMYER